MDSDPTSHRRIAADAFNRTWELIDKQDRTADEVELMIHMAHASAWHWQQYPEHTPTNLSVGAWQLSRVYALAGLADRARHYGQQSLDLALDNELGAFYVGYGFEALARAETVRGDQNSAKDLAGRNELKVEYLTSAREQAAAVTSDEYRKPLLDDLATI